MVDYFFAVFCDRCCPYANCLPPPPLFLSGYILCPVPVPFALVHVEYCVPLSLPGSRELFEIFPPRVCDRLSPLTFRVSHLTVLFSGPYEK